MLNLAAVRVYIKIRNKYAEMITNILRSYKSVIIQEKNDTFSAALLPKRGIKISVQAIMFH